MQHKKYVIYLVLGMYLVIAETAPVPPGMISACVLQECDVDVGPVCAMDDSGVPKSFPNLCDAKMESCQFETYFAVIKHGEC